MPRPIDTKASYYPGLDGLRALAVALVIGYHIGVPHLGGGLLGVGVFFTLSGYLISSLLLTAWRTRGFLGLSTFWLRRARRLLPAVVLLLIVVLLATAVVEPGRFGDRMSESLAALFYIANWATIAKGDSYFNRFQGPSPLEHLWSLSVEEQFYIFWPLLLLGLLTIFQDRLKQMAAVTFTLGAISMIMLALTFHVGQDATRAYEGTDTRAGGLLWGAALAMVWHPSTADAVVAARHRLALDTIGLLGLAGLGGLVIFTEETSPFIYRGGIALLTAATCAILVAAASSRTVVARVLGVAPMRWLGERTYGIYLWHMPFTAFLPQRAFYGNTVLRGIIVVVLTLVFASLSWSVVENPIRTWGLASAWRRGTAAVRGGARRAVPPFIAGGAVVAAGAVGALAAVNHLPQTSVREIATKEANNAPMAPAPTKAKPASGAAKTSCEKVVHIGDSTSLGLEDGPETNITDPTKRLRAQYLAVGVQSVDEDIKGGRNIFEHFQRDTNGQEAVAAQVAKGYNGCYVIALGMNDAATIAKGGSGASADERIDLIMKQVGNHPVLWVNTVTQAWTNNPLYANTHMQQFNQHLVDATKRYPDLRVYDWASEALPHPEWFQNDANHNDGIGSAAKAHGIAEGLVAASPKDQAASKLKVVASK